jgi:hypothetical protein
VGLRLSRGVIAVVAVLVLVAAMGGLAGQVRVPSIPPPKPTPNVFPPITKGLPPDEEGQVPKFPKATTPAPASNGLPPFDPCAIPASIAEDSARLDSSIVRLLAILKTEPDAYKKQAPTNCAMQLVRYRVSALSTILDRMEGK